VTARADRPVLVVAGEASGDRIAAGVARVLARSGIECAGMGGEASLRAGVRLIADMRRSPGMGLTEVLGRLPFAMISYARLVRFAQSARPRAAILVDYIEHNALLGRRLRGLGIPVLQCVAPQVWAWRAGRLHTAGRAFDRLAVTLPFEEELWKRAGVDARYVGNPALDVAPRSRREARVELGVAGERPAVALLPGSRRHEVRRLAPAMLGAMRELARSRVDARLLMAHSLDEATARWLRGEAARAGVAIVPVKPERGASEWLAAFDTALVASGTATLECALIGVPPVIAYRVSPVTAAVARRMLRVSSIGLPNVLLGRRAFPELLQRDVVPSNLARELAGVLDRGTDFDPLYRELRRTMAPPPDGLSSSERIVAFVADWLGVVPSAARSATMEPWAGPA
jgi:lipid-A-disaccharide synthase